MFLSIEESSLDKIQMKIYRLILDLLATFTCYSHTYFMFLSPCQYIYLFSP